MLVRRVLAGASGVCADACGRASDRGRRGGAGVPVRGPGGRAFEHELRRRHAGAQHAVGGEIVALQGQAAEGLAQRLERQTGIEQRAEEHVARDAGEAVEIQNLHGPKRQL